ncbi:trans-sulfuration enzyme family protein [Litoreibacter roseus]|uniref:Cystathionine gamma-synthase n=1 Tax=Litoreibacter roseus TaxID=2601869 RepID=A0A6N6JNE9_9RHOB|nr:aminotransferase class I/II-fold pyridoxal phosphate-dependent enzyme [Litoreibacter roseus]GFE66938.1 cystathionine gamma-synthase [Litoreibacter roseus]
MTADIPANLVRRTAFPSSVSRSVVTPLQPSVVYASPDPDALDDQYEGRAFGYTYSREGHPNATVLAQKIDALEGAEGGWITASGMAAVTATMLGLLKQGDHIVGGDQLYGRSLRMLTQDLPRYGITASFADPTDAAAVEAAVTPSTKLILVEVVSNPTLRVADMEAIAEIAKRHRLVLVVDNTFTTPRAYRPFDHGADVVIHSVTKLLAGHSDAMLGYVAAKDADHRAAIDGTIVTLGLTPSPYDCWMAERGLMSFHLRYDRAEENAALLAEHLAGFEKVARVLYPGRPDHPDHNRAGVLLGPRFGNMVSFEVLGGRDAANALTRAMPDMAFAPTLGDIGTTLSHAASSSHRGLTPDGRQALGIMEGFFRISVGVEDITLLREEFSRGLAALA